MQAAAQALNLEHTLYRCTAPRWKGMQQTRLLPAIKESLVMSEAACCVYKITVRPHALGPFQRPRDRLFLEKSHHRCGGDGNPSKISLTGSS
jgi:hypothetical protein